MTTSSKPLFLPECDLALKKNGISFDLAMHLISLEKEEDVRAVMNFAAKLTAEIHGKRADLCQIMNAKSGLCGEDCGFCSQSLRHHSAIEKFKLVPLEVAVQRARTARENGAKEFCIVTSGRRLNSEEFKRVLEMIREIRNQVAINVDVSIGFLSREEAVALREAGAQRVNHNLQASSDFYTQIVSTHSYQDRKQTLHAIRGAGLEICCGVIWGMGETREDRIRCAFEIKSFKPECVPVNILDPRPGTPLENQPGMETAEVLKTLAVYRLIFPETCLKLAAGRKRQLGNDQKKAWNAGVNGLIIGDYLTVSGVALEEDFKMLKELGVEWSRS